MEEEEGNSGATLPLEPRRQELLAAAVREGDTPAAVVSIDMNIEGRRENFLQQVPPPTDVAGHQQRGVPKRRLSTCSRPVVLWALELNNNSLTIQKERSCLGCIRKGFSRTMSLSLAHYLKMCVCVSPHVVDVCVFVHIVS